MLVIFTSCEKDSNSSDSSAINAEKDKIINAYELSVAFNDTLITVYNTTANPYHNPGCLKYDEMFHHSDSLFKVHYALFCDEMYKNKVMMPDYTPSNSMMQGGMMGTGMMDMMELRADTSEVNGYYTNMHKLMNSHIPYHSGIYN